MTLGALPSFRPATRTWEPLRITNLVHVDGELICRSPFSQIKPFNPQGGNVWQVYGRVWFFHVDFVYSSVDCDHRHSLFHQQIDGVIQTEPKRSQ
ncbi:hypothetical protein CO180_03790 [candidate division WWE3 bacterium CG_4_9_14_3_um_filter_41_6]|nr:MAG: hypothetical protein CO180_03790 [candidate division WWE3 bacterium CG_4_9_14_3_um_filter_41_6]